MRRRRTTLGVALTAATAASPAQAAIQEADRLEQAVTSEVNAVRAQRGLPRVRFSWALSAAAEAKSRSMARLGYFGHTAPDGSPFWKQIERHYAADGYRKWRVGQNLAWSAPRISARTIVQRWLASPPHRAILLSRDFREAAAAAVRATQATGVYGGQDVTIVTLDVGVRRR